MQNINKRNLRRSKYYSLLIKAGYSSKFATKYKDYSFATVMNLCQIKRDSLQSIDKIDMDVQARIERVLMKTKKEI